MWKDCETELDYLDFDYLIAVLREMINNDDLLPSSIGVYGDWGSGKSSLIRMSMNNLQDDADIVCMVFNSWLFEGYEDGKTALIGSILDTIQEKRKPTATAKTCLLGLYKSLDKFKLLKNGIKYGLDFLTTGGIGTISDIAINSIKASVDGSQLEKIKDQVSDELNNKALRDDINSFRNEFNSLLEQTKIKRLVIFIDELDRCSPDMILDILEAIRLFLFIGNSVFIIGADERHISYAVKKRFQDVEGVQIDIGKEYLEKIIQYPVRIPRLNTQEVEYYITCLLFQKELDEKEFEQIVTFFKKEKVADFLGFRIDYKSISAELPGIAEKIKASIVLGKQLGAVLASGLNGNPRHCKRFLNSLAMREKMAENKGIKLDRGILAKIMMLEYFKPPMFKQLALMHFSNSVGNELYALENDEITEEHELRVWRDDPWTKEWIGIDPQLSEENLTPYFYFTRTSLNEKFIIGGVKLSPPAEDVLSKLLSKTDFARKAAIKMADNINDSEAAAILSSIYSEMVTSSSIDTQLFKSYIHWGQTKETLYANVVSDLNGIPGEKMRYALIPLIEEFAKKANKMDQIQEDIERWAETNDDIRKMSLQKKGE